MPQNKSGSGKPLRVLSFKGSHFTWMSMTPKGKNKRGCYGTRWHMRIPVIKKKSFGPSWGFYGQPSRGHFKVGETHCVRVEVNEAIGVAHGASSVLDDPDVGSGKVDIGLQHFHDHFRWRGTIDAFEHDCWTNQARMQKSKEKERKINFGSPQSLTVPFLLQITAEGTCSGKAGSITKC